ncbi:Phosphoribosylglycinamide formyltransferase [Candidatus Bilamarchaeum dharawalense]|uniref:phosphoribosylglycinamide formyltransferase 1 n=1 Tax=Candidatus Bilamarchaeum dharawalense TaxID=2885759 RepID=A0A5E4LRN5_9ARCH|nr:Phosphoribosylglycinamide formyltransferase [Candidatus Bilamarchaeum dharawalense]
MAIKIAILASGRGSNFLAILNEINAGRCNAEIKVLITNNPEAPAIEIAKKNSIPVEFIDRTKFKKREEMDDYIKLLLDKYKTELVVLAGYMLILKGKSLLEAYRNRIINIHPALLPAFKGEDAQKQAFDAGVKISGVTIHFVDETLDGGPIIYQEAVDISDCNSAEETAAKILKVEHKAYAKVVDSFSKGAYVLKGRRTQFINFPIKK